LCGRWKREQGSKACRKANPGHEPEH